MTLVPFLLLTVTISLAGFVCVLLVPGAQSPDRAAGLPFWLLMVWGPSLAAIILAVQAGTLGDLLARAIDMSSVPWEVWGLTLAPLLLLAMLLPVAPDAASPLGVGTLLAMVGLNLILGPLGEELGWRGVMQTHLNTRIGWLEASVIVGVAWFVWHLPLWTIAAPQAEIPLHLFGLHCLAYAIIIGAAHTLSNGSILPAILIHLSVNLAANMALFGGFQNSESWFSTSLIPYGLLALAAYGLVWLRTGQFGVAWLAEHVP